MQRKFNLSRGALSKHQLYIGPASRRLATAKIKSYIGFETFFKISKYRFNFLLLKKLFNAVDFRKLNKSVTSAAEKVAANFFTSRKLYRDEINKINFSKVMISPGPAFQECTGSCHENVSAPKAVSSNLRSTECLTVFARIEIVTILVNYQPSYNTSHTQWNPVTSYCSLGSPE